MTTIYYNKRTKKYKIMSVLEAIEFMTVARNRLHWDQTAILEIDPWLEEYLNNPEKREAILKSISSVAKRLAAYGKMGGLIRSKR